MPYDHGRLLDPVCEENIVLGKDWLNACLSNGFSLPVDAFPAYRAGAFMESLSSLLKLDSSSSFRPATLHTVFGFSLPVPNYKQNIIYSTLSLSACRNYTHR